MSAGANVRNDKACDQCGSTHQVSEFYGRERCDPTDRWYGCWECRWAYIRHRLYGPHATGLPGDVEILDCAETDSVETETDRETGHNDPLAW